LTSFFKLTGLTRLFPTSAVVSRYYMGNVPANKAASVDVLSGACMMVSKKMLDRVGGFDEKFFMYGEDIDLSIRIKKTGFKNIYLPKARMLHFKGESTEKLRPEYRERFYGAMTLFAEKYFSSNRFSLALLKAAIWLVKKKPVLQINKRQHLPHTNVLIVANSDRFNEMIHRIKLAKEPMVITGRIALHDDEDNPYTCTLEELPNWLTTHPQQTVLFCESPTLSFFEIIRQMERLKGQANFLLHAEGGRCVLGENGFKIGAMDVEAENPDSLNSILPA
jgi:N-acetylglucosaminyl-diphospho-decaprenol L-rhamnosyltransferase